MQGKSVDVDKPGEDSTDEGKENCEKHYPPDIGGIQYAGLDRRTTEDMQGR